MIVEAVEKAATEHRGRAWVHSAFTDLNHRATHPCGIFTSMPFSVFAKLDISPSGEEQFAAELSGFGLIRSRTTVATPVPVAGGLVVTGAGTLLLSEALPERGTASGQAAEGRVAGDYAAIGHALASLHQVRGESFGLAEFNGFFGPLPQSNQPVSSGTWAEFYAERRVQPMLRLAVDSRYLPSELARGVERVAARLPVLSGPDPVPTLLHGDAQQNNFVSTADGAVAIDVAPYFGHPEADLALVDNYSPVDPALFHAYMESAPIGPRCGGCTPTSRRSRSTGRTRSTHSFPASTPRYASTRSCGGTARERPSTARPARDGCRRSSTYTVTADRLRSAPETLRADCHRAGQHGRCNAAHHQSGCRAASGLQRRASSQPSPAHARRPHWRPLRRQAPQAHQNTSSRCPQRPQRSCGIRDRDRAALDPR